MAGRRGDGSVSGGARARRLLALLVFACGCNAPPDPPPEPVPVTSRVVLVHGLGRSAGSLSSLARRLAAEGFEVVKHDYPSTAGSIDEHAAALDRRLTELDADPRASFHFVTHSLGGIVVRALARNHGAGRIARVVMLGPPNQGSELADLLRDAGILGPLLGPSAESLGTGEDDAPRALGPVPFECGVIAGDRSLNPFGGLIFDGPNDGKVSVEGAKVDGMRDFLVVHHGHTFLMNADDVQRQVVRFLREGAFDHAE